MPATNKKKMSGKEKKGEKLMKEAFKAGDKASSMKLLREAATKWNHLEAKWHLGKLLESDEEYDEAGSLFEQVCEASPKRSEAWYALGYCRSRGETEVSAAVECYETAAELGDTWAQCRLGDFYREGKKIDRDYDRAFEYYSKAAKAGSAEGKSRIAMMYSGGLGRDRDWVKANLLWEEAASNGSLDAHFNLGQSYFTLPKSTLNFETTSFFIF